MFVLFSIDSFEFSSGKTRKLKACFFLKKMKIQKFDIVDCLLFLLFLNFHVFEFLMFCCVLVALNL